LNARRQTIRHIFCALLFSSSIASAATPKLKIKTKHGNALEEGKRDQIERLAKQYDLTKYTLTRNIVIEQGAINHSMPELTLNPRFLDNDDLAPIGLHTRARPLAASRTWPQPERIALRKTSHDVSGHTNAVSRRLWRLDRHVLARDRLHARMAGNGGFSGRTAGTEGH
jgi:hypothetical protein